MAVWVVGEPEAVREVWELELRGLVASILEILGSFLEKWDSQSVSPESVVKSASQVSVSGHQRKFTLIGWSAPRTRSDHE